MMKLFSFFFGVFFALEVGAGDLVTEEAVL